MSSLSESASKDRCCLPVRLSLTPMFVAIAVCYAVGEFYPFSSFPMYSKFDDRTYLAILRSAEGERSADPANGKDGVVSAEKAVWRRTESAQAENRKAPTLIGQSNRSARRARSHPCLPQGIPMRRRLLLVGKLDGLRLIDIRITLEGRRTLIRNAKKKLLSFEGD